MLSRTVSAAAIFVVMSAGAAMAQARGPVFPAEMPPESFTGAQYVDSNGCVFIRAGFNGRVNWVPRFGDDRRPMCGMQPSFAASGPAPRVVTATAPVVMAAPRAIPAPTAMAPRVQPRTAPAPVLVGGVPYSVPPEVIRPRAGGAQVIQVQGLDTRWSFYDRTGPSPCTNLSPHSQMYMVPSPARPELPLRCGPQELHPADAVRQLAPRGNQWEPWDGVNPGPMAPNVYQLPQPYAPRWPDTHLQAPAQPRAAAPVQMASAPRAHLSTMGAAPAPAQVGGRFVQVGTFGVEANSQGAVARLQSAGLPVAIGRTERNGRALQIVMAGPFASDADLRAALGTARSMGFADAFTR